MPLQNRVTPFSEIVGDAARGEFMGNRGILHDPATRTLLKRRWTTKAWIICVCEFRGRRRQVMGPGSYTELFFLDEATALAAGHRPCFECRRADAVAFRAAWSAARGEAPPKAAAMDTVLHAERLEGRARRRHPVAGALAESPDGTMAVAEGVAYLVARGRTWRWSPTGYSEAAPAGETWLLTPPSTVAALRSGYHASLHASVAR